MNGSRRDKKKRTSMFDRVLEKLKANEQEKSPTEHENSANTAIIENYLLLQKPAQKQRTTPTWIDSIADTETQKALEKDTKTALNIFDKGDTSVARKINAHEIEDMQKDRIKKLGSKTDWCRPYKKDKEKDYQREVNEHIAAINDLANAYKDGVSIDQNISENILRTIDDNLLSKKERIDILEQFSHTTLIAYLALCEKREEKLENFEGVSDEYKKEVIQIREDVRELALNAIEKSFKYRNKDIIQKLEEQIGKQRFEKEWQKNGFFRKYCEKVIDEFSSEFKKYFEKNPAEIGQYYSIMHPKRDENGKNKMLTNDSGMDKILKAVEISTGFINTASQISKYALKITPFQ
ncbi:hypothetical protein JW851_01790 [Candidatus Woesearchaeota archaeon]|nr:hypothetical protein [Candidatus Woesearchaeota archaeon]